MKYTLYTFFYKVEVSVGHISPFPKRSFGWEKQMTCVGIWKQNSFSTILILGIFPLNLVTSKFDPTLKSCAYLYISHLL